MRDCGALRREVQLSTVGFVYIGSNNPMGPHALNHLFAFPAQASTTVPLSIPRVIPDYLSTSPAGPPTAAWGCKMATPVRYNSSIPSAGSSVGASPGGAAASSLGRVGLGGTTPIAAVMRTSASSVRSFAAAAAAVVGSFTSRGSRSPGGAAFSVESFGRHHVRLPGGLQHRPCYPVTGHPVIGCPVIGNVSKSRSWRESSLCPPPKPNQRIIVVSS